MGSPHDFETPLSERWATVSFVSEGIVALDYGIYTIWFARNYKAHKPNTVLLDNALATMAAHLVHQDRPVISVCGDGGFMMEEPGAGNRSTTVVIMHDDSYGMIRWKQANMGFTDFGLDYGNPNFIRDAEGCGANGYSVESAGLAAPARPLHLQPRRARDRLPSQLQRE